MGALWAIAALGHGGLWGFGKHMGDQGSLGPLGIALPSSYPLPGPGAGLCSEEVVRVEYYIMYIL